MQAPPAQFATKKEEPVQAPQMYIISKSCSYVPVRADYIQVWPGAKGQPVARPRSNPVWIDIKNDLMNELIFEVENKKTVGIL